MNNINKNIKLQPVIKWTGSKRFLADSLMSYFPKEIDTYYEPFVGGGSVVFRLLHSDITINNIICSDINSDLINLWNMIKENPDYLIQSYNNMWHELNSKINDVLKKECYYEVRKRYNTLRQPEDFLFLSRTCTNGFIRYNNKGEFNTSFHIGRKGIEPEKYSKIILDWSDKLNKNNVQFIHRNYKEIITQENDFLYLDPPYANTDVMYFGELKYDEFWDWMSQQPCKYLLSFNGTRNGRDNTYDVPKQLYDEHIYMESGHSKFKSLQGKEKEAVTESLYIKL